MAHIEIDDEKLLVLVANSDKELFEAGKDIKQRSWDVPIKIMNELGYQSFPILGSGEPPILKRIRAIFASIYRKQDMAMGGHIGVFMYRDIFARIAVPMVIGVQSINPFEYVELTPIQQRMVQTELDQTEIYIDQFADVADVQYGVDELKEPYSHQELAVRFLGLSRLNLHSAAAVLTGGYDHRGAVQAALLASELALKSGGAGLGLSERELKDRFGHRNSDAADFLGSKWSSFDVSRVKRVLDAQPSYVLNRYSDTQPERREVGHLVMGAQYVVSEVVRQMSDRDFRSGLTPPTARRYPA